MPEIGDILPSKGNRKRKSIWHACVKCGQERWVGLYRGKARSVICRECNRKALIEKNKTIRYCVVNSGMWKGGRTKDTQGYILVMIMPNDFFYSMANSQGYVREHRLVVAKFLGRCLHRWEIVHHKNRVKDDNRIENLQLVSDDRHKQITILENRINFLEKRITLLEAENILLKTPTSGGREQWRPTKQR